MSQLVYKTRKENTELEIEGEFVIGDFKKKIPIGSIYENQFILSIQKKEFPLDMHCYVLGRKVASALDIIMFKSIRDEQEFDQEVEQIKKIFNPFVI